VGEAGFGVTQADAEPSPARRFGDKNLFYGDVLPDTDLLVAPTGGGVELFDLLRSELSPQELRFAIDVPAGAALRADGAGGAEVLRDGATLTRIATPMATDAQGTEVPVDLSVVADEIVLNVAHQGGEFAFPILVDPVVEDWANNPNNWYLTNAKWDALSNGAWNYASNNSQLKSWICCWEGSHAGLMISSEKNVFYGAKQFGQWSYSTANSKTYVTHAWLTPFWRNVESCGSSAEPHDYVGMLWEPGEVWNPVVSDKAKEGTYSLDGNGQAFIIGMGTGNGVWIGCNRYVYAGGVALWLDDQWPPVISAPTVTPSSGWVSDTGSINIGVNASDEGLGIYRATITPDGKAAISKTTGCTGLYGNRCPNTTSVNFNLTGLSFGEGVRSAGVSAEDPSGKAASGPSFTTKVDRTPPEVTLSGQLAQATNEGGATEQPAGQGDELVLPVYNLNIAATDGSNATNLTRRSGVKNIEVLLDGIKQSVEWTAQTATEDSKPMTKTYPLKLSTVTTVGAHTLKVLVSDQVGNVRERKIEFEYFPATGMKDEYVMQHFPLPDGLGDESEEEHPARPELAVNVMNGNLVYREQDIDVNGAGADLEVERFYNSMLPTAENTEWGDGWTLAETPEIEPTSSSQAEVLDSSGAVEDKVALPTEVGASKFDPVLQATIEKRAGGGYEMTDETGESATSVSFDPTGQAEALLTEGYAKVDYSYEAGELAEIEVQDPATFSGKPEIPQPQLVTAPTFGGSFGTNGSGNGQFKVPADAAVDKKGNLWVADKTNNRLERFNEDGEFAQVVGAVGTAGGKLSAPAGVAVDGSGNVWVADTGNNRIQEFNEKGEFVLTFGKDVNKTKVTALAPEAERNVCTAASGNTCQAGVAGSAAGQLKAPQGIAASSGGNVWVADTGNSRLQKFSPAGALINNISGYGSEAGKLKEPSSIALAPDGSIWVADTLNNRVQQWNSSLALVRTFGTEGTGSGQFKRPAGIDIDAAGNVWVADQLNNRLQQFDSSAQFLGKYGSSGSGDAQFNFASMTGLATDSKGHIWVADPGNNRVQQWLLPVEKPTYLSSFGSNGSGDGQMKAPSDVALGLAGAVWVADKTNNRIEKFDAKGKYLAKFGSLGTGDGQFNRPASIAVDRDGNLLVVDSNNNRIEKFDPSGQFISKFGSAGTGNGQFATPEGVTTDFQGNIWVADTDNGRLQKFDENGAFLKVVASKGSGLGQLGEPSGLDIGPEGNVWVADWLNNRISAFSPEGTYLGSFGSAGSGPGQFNHPDEIEIDSHGNVWVGDQTNNRVQRFNLKGEYLGQFGTSGAGEGNLSLAFPMGIAADSVGHIWVTDPNNNRVQQWRLGNYFLKALELDLSDGDPAVTVETPSGLVSKVSGNAAGTHTYAHVGDDLTAHKGPAGETKYEYDASGRMTKVTLPNGTWGSIAYQAEARVKSVTVDPAGTEGAKTTTFEYTDSPTRRTKVVISGAPDVTYDIGDDGSVLKWWNTAQPPTFDDLSGTLYENRNKEGGLLPGDHYLDIQGTRRRE
jgi:YD repeat-containing protein